jgi:hypothetical protein
MKNADCIGPLPCGAKPQVGPPPDTVTVALPLPVAVAPVNVVAAPETKLAVTVQGAVTAFVVYVVPVSVPLQVPPTLATYPVSGVTVNEAVAPCVIVCGVEGEMLPLAPALGVTVYELSVNVTLTAQAAVIALVVNVLPDGVPGHVPLHAVE